MIKMLSENIRVKINKRINLSEQVEIHLRFQIKKHNYFFDYWKTLNWHSVRIRIEDFWMPGKQCDSLEMSSLYGDKTEVWKPEKFDLSTRIEKTHQRIVSELNIRDEIEKELSTHFFS